MLDLVIAIIGGEDTTYNNVADNLADLLSENYIVYIPSYINSNGLRIVFSWLEQTEVSFKRLRKSLLIDKLIEHKVGIEEPSNVALIVLGTEGIEQDIEKAFQDNIPVLDLTRGLYSVSEADFAASPEESQIVLDGSETNAETLSDVGGIATKDAVLVAPTGPILNLVEPDPFLLEERIAELERKVDRIMTQVAIGETNWEPQIFVGDALVNGEKVGEVVATLVSTTEPEEVLKFYKSKRGKLRKAGNSKARPGETEVWLSEKQIEHLE